MTKNEFLAASLPYGLVVINEVGFEKMYCAVHYSYEFDTGFYEFKPILRNLTDLTKECVQVDYNDGEPFVPIVELAKIVFGDISVIETKNKKNISGIRFVDEDSDTCVLAYHHVTGSFGAHVERLEKTENEFINVYYQLQLFQQLFKWHFDLIIENCEKVYVTEEFNPYK